MITRSVASLGLAGLVFGMAVFATSNAFAQTGAAPVQSGQGQRLNIEGIKQKYWAKGEESEIRVVQNRTFSKAGKFELGAFVGTVAQDPFLSVKNAGGTFAYYLSEYFSFDLLYWSYFVNKSDAFKTFESQYQTTVNTNYPYHFVGAEFMYSPLYGKLSLMGAAIIYFDIHTMLGAGMAKTDSGNYFMPLVGIGQNVFLTKALALRLDYRLGYYKEEVPRKVMTGVAGTRTTWSDIITLGLSFFL